MMTYNVTLPAYLTEGGIPVLVTQRALPATACNVTLPAYLTEGEIPVLVTQQAVHAV